MAEEQTGIVPATLVERVAKAIYGSSVSQARDRAASYDFQLERLKRVFETARNEPDRSASILLFALMEDLMLQCFKLHLDGSIKGGWEGVTGGNGLLATASDRITMLELLRWVRPSTANDLRLMKSIRNRFAHHSDVDEFSDKKILGWVTSLTPYETFGAKVWPDEVRDSWRKLTPREIYLTRACCVVLNLVNDLAVGPVARIAGVCPGDVEGDKFDDIPKPLKDVKYAISDCVLAVLPPRPR